MKKIKKEEEEEEEGTHPFAALPSVREHLLQSSHRQGLLQHKVTDAQVWRNMLEEEEEKERGRLA